jgi:hypothetical protein
VAVWALLFVLFQVSAPPPPAPSRPVPELHAHPDWPTARAADVASPRAITAAFFAAISAPKGGTLDRARLRSLFTPDGRIEVPIPGAGARATDVAFLSPDQYAASSDLQTASEGFFDHLLAAHVQSFGVMAHVYAAYESRAWAEDSKPFVRGMKSFELLESGGRWYITQVAWDRERDGLVIPGEYLRDAED